MTNNILECLKQYRIIVALRGIAPDKVVATAKALYEGGIRMLEITFDQASEGALTDTPAAIRAIKKTMGEKLLVGAGTVVTVKQAEAAVAAGAKYLLAPNFDPEVVAAAQRLGVASIPGALTPSEIAAAWRAGATMVKLFPVGNFGPAYVKAITAPLSHIPLLGMGGINRQNMLEYLSLPSLVGVGIGSNLAPVSLIQSGDYIGLTKLAKSYTRLLA